MKDTENLDAADSGHLGHVQLSATEQKTWLVHMKSICKTPIQNRGKKTNPTAHA